MHNKKITPTLRQIYERDVQQKTDKELEEVLCVKEEWDNELHECIKAEYIRRQNKLS